MRASQRLCKESLDMKHTQHFIQLQAKFRLQRNPAKFVLFLTPFVWILLCMIFSVACTRQNAPEQWWYQTTRINTFLLKTAQGDILDSAMTIETQPSQLLITTTINGARIVRSDIVRATSQGLFKVLICDKSYTKQSFSEALFYTLDRKQAPTVLRACPGDTVSVFFHGESDTTLVTAIGTLSVRTVREIDKTGVIVDYFIDRVYGIVQINYTHGVWDSTAHKYHADSLQHPFEQALLRTSESVKMRKVL